MICSAVKLVARGVYDSRSVANSPGVLLQKWPPLKEGESATRKKDNIAAGQTAAGLSISLLRR
jgi:hypothetical protein